MAEPTEPARALHEPELCPDVESIYGSISSDEPLALRPALARRCTDSVTQLQTVVTRTPSSPAPFDIPSWDGSDPAGLTLLVHCGPSLGQSIQLARYLLLLTGRRANVLLTCPPPLARLFARLPGVRVIAESEALPQPVNAQVQLGDLPALFGTTPATIPAFASYLRPAPGIMALWRDRLRPPSRGGPRPFLLGLSCPADTSGATPSPLPSHEAAALLASVPRVRLVALSSDRTVARAPLPGQAVGEAAHTLHDLADAAAVITQLDLVVAAADPVIAHLGAATGKPVWAIVPFAEGLEDKIPTTDADDDTPWYPSMLLFRQAARGDWSDVLDAVYRRLRAKFPTTVTPVAA